MQEFNTAEFFQKYKNPVVLNEFFIHNLNGKPVRLYKGEINVNDLVAKGIMINHEAPSEESEPFQLQDYKVRIKDSTGETKWYNGGEFDRFVIDPPQSNGGKKRKRITTSRKNKKNKKSIKIRRNKKRSLMRS
jgi:hypothetical protein